MISVKVELLEPLHVFHDDCLQKCVSSNSATSSDVIDLTPLADSLGTFRTKTGMCPNCATEIKVQRLYENYTSHKAKLLPNAGRKDAAENLHRK